MLSSKNRCFLFSVIFSSYILGISSNVNAETKPYLIYSNQSFNFSSSIEAYSSTQTLLQDGVSLPILRNGLSTSADLINLPLYNLELDNSDEQQVAIADKIYQLEQGYHIKSINLESSALSKQSQNSTLIAQNLTEQETPRDSSQPTLEQLRQELKIQPKVILTEQTYPPSLSAGIPSAFGASWGDLFITASGATAGKERSQVDGSVTLGVGLGDSYKLAGLTVAYNIGSIRNFGSNGTFDLQASRVIHAEPTNQVAAAIGWSAFGQYGTEGNIPSTVWGGLSSVILLNPEDAVNPLPLFLSVGVGGGYFSNYDGATNAFGGIGLQVLPQLGISAAWSGVGLNLSASFVPVPTIPLTINAIGGDLTNTSEGGSRFILNVTYGYNFIPRNY